MQTLNVHEETLFAKIGGINALHELIDRFYDKVMKDQLVNYFFHGSDMRVQRGKMKAFLMMALGGPVKFTGKDIRHAHVKLVEHGLSDTHFDAIGGHLTEALVELNIDNSLTDQIIQLVESVRNEVLNR